MEVAAGEVVIGSAEVVEEAAADAANAMVDVAVDAEDLNNLALRCSVIF